jgi:hypothetical protein
LLVWMSRLWPSLLRSARIVQPDTILRRHRTGFRAYWRWKTRPGRPPVGRELRELIHRMSKENPFWGARRIHGELLKLEFAIAESRVSKCMFRRRGPAVANLADIPAQPRGCHCGNRSLRGSNPDIRVPVCVSRHRPRSTTTALVYRYAAPDRRMAGAADRGGISLGYGVELFGARQ